MSTGIKSRKKRQLRNDEEILLSIFAEIPVDQQYIFLRLIATKLSIPPTTGNHTNFHTPVDKGSYSKKAKK